MAHRRTRVLVRYIPARSPIYPGFTSRGYIRKEFADGSVEVEDLDERSPHTGRPAVHFVRADRILERVEEQ